MTNYMDRLAAQSTAIERQRAKGHHIESLDDPAYPDWYAVSIPQQHGGTVGFFAHYDAGRDVFDRRADWLD